MQNSDAYFTEEGLQVDLLASMLALALRWGCGGGDGEQMFPALLLLTPWSLSPGPL